MDEQQQLELIDEAFGAFRAGGPLVHPVGADAARATVRHRRRVRIVIAATAAIVAVLLPATGFATGFFGATGKPVPGTSVEPSVGPSESEPSPSAATSITPFAPDGRISPTDLAHATIELGGHPDQSLCRAKTFTFHGSPTMGADSNGRNQIAYTVEKVINVDFDHDGALETVAQINCAIEGHDSIVVALDRDTSGAIVTVGQVTITGYQEPVQAVFDLRADPNGAVGVQVGDGQVCCDTTDAMIEHQWRSFSYDGTKFTQTAGRTSFTAVAPGTDLGVLPLRLNLGKPVNGVRTGTFSVTVTNWGPNPAPGAVIRVGVGGAHALPGTLRITTDLHDCAINKADRSIQCHLFGFKVKESRTFTFQIGSGTANDPAYLATPDPDTVWTSIQAEQPGVRVLNNDTQTLDAQLTNKVTLA
jgi:hypothetical protein